MSKTEQVLKGIEIIHKYQPDAEFAAEHETLYFGSYDKEQMTTEDFQQMEALGWIEEYESWAIYV